MTSYHSLSAPGVYAKPEDLIQCNVPLQRLLVAVRFRVPTPVEVALYGESLSQQVLEGTAPAESHAAYLLKRIPAPRIRKAVNDIEFLTSVREDIIKYFDFDPTGEQPLDYVTQAKVAVVTAEELQLAKEDKFTASGYNSVISQAGRGVLGEQIRILLRSQEQQLPPFSTIKSFMEGKVTNSHPLSIAPYGPLFPPRKIPDIAEEAIQTLYDQVKRKKDGIDFLDDISDHLIDQYFGRWIVDFFQRKPRQTPPSREKLLNWGAAATNDKYGLN